MLYKLFYWNLTTKIIFLFLFNTMIAILLVFSSNSYLAKIGHELHDVTAKDIPLTKIVSKITVHQLEQAIHLERAAKYAEIMSTNGPDSMKAEGNFIKEYKYFLRLAEKVDNEIITAEKMIESILQTETNTLIIKEFTYVFNILKEVEKEHKIFDQHAEEVFELYKAGQLKDAHILNKKIEVEEDALDKKLEELLFELENFTEKALITVEGHEKEAEIFLIRIAIGAILLSLFVSTFIIWGVARPIKKMKTTLRKLADGEVDPNLPKFSLHSEMGQVFNALTLIGFNIEAVNRTQASITFELDGTIITANSLFCDVMGYELHEIKGKHHSMFAADGVADSHEYKAFWEALNEGEAQTGEFCRVDKNGNDVWIAASYNPILNLDGKPIRVTKYATDITADMKRRHKVEMISLVAEHSDNSVVITDANENIEYVNQGFTKLTGYSLEECIGKNPGKLLQGKDTDPETRAEIRDALDAKKPFYNEILNYTKDGQAYWISMSINPVFDKDGNLERFVSIQGNVTRNKMISLENERGMKESVGILQALAAGDLSQTMVGEYKGDFAPIKVAINETIGKLQAIINEINKSVSMASQGNFSYEIDTSNSQGFMLELSRGINDICHISNQGLSEVKRSILALSNGDLSQNIEGNYEGEFLEIKESFNDTLNQLSFIMDDVKKSVGNISKGDFSYSIDTKDKKGFLMELASGINSINNILNKGLSEVKNSVNELSRGNLDHPVMGQYEGQFNEMKNAVNTTLHQLTTVIGEIKTSATEISEGNFSNRISLDNKEGFLKELSESINEISDTSNKGLSEIGNVLRALSEGNLDKTIDNAYQGTFLEIKDLVNGTIQNLKTVVGEIQGAADAVKHGDFTVRIDTSEKKGFLFDLSEGLNEIATTSSKGLNEIEEVLNALSQGSLIQHMDGDYEGTFNDIKNTLNSTIIQLRDMVLKIKETANSVTSSSSEISDGSADLSRRTEIQASTLEQTTAATEQLALTVRNNTLSAQDANTKADDARNIATEGEEIVGNAINAMEQIQESSSKVTDIIGVIDEIAFQTNLLALNAAVEAARAGEAGKGFAVVASEVRSLAGRSAAASKEIKDLINLSVNEVQNGSELVRDSGKTLNNIIESVNNVANLVNQIAKESESQSEGINEVSQAVVEMDSTTQQNAALVEQSAASSQSMSEQAQILLELTEFFKVEEEDPVVNNIAV